MENNIVSRFNVKNSYLSIFKNRIKLGIYRWITKKRPNLFLRSQDLISEAPMILGVHEPCVTSFIDFVACSGYNHFLIDIGANVGLSSCQNGRMFQEVHLFEPNPLCCHILEVNTAITLDANKYSIHPFGLGESDKKVCLTVPKHNWGGAFIDDSFNSYDNDTLIAKDGFKSFDRDKYFEVKIEIKNAVVVLRQLLLELHAKGLRRGVVKIDVEGYEPIVLKGIAEALPVDMSLFVVFESWSKKLILSSILDAFGGRASVLKLVTDYPWSKACPKILRPFILPFNNQVVSRLVPIQEKDAIGDIVIEVSKAAQK